MTTRDDIIRMQKHLGWTIGELYERASLEGVECVTRTKLYVYLGKKKRGKNECDIGSGCADAIRAFLLQQLERE